MAACRAYVEKVFVYVSIKVNNDFKIRFTTNKKAFEFIQEPFAMELA